MRVFVHLLSMKEYVALKPLEWRDDVTPWNSRESRGPLLMIGRGGVSPQNESILSFLPSMCTYATNESTPSQLQQEAQSEKEVSEKNSYLASLRIARGTNDSINVYLYTAAGSTAEI